MLRAFTLSIAQLGDPRILRVLVKSLIVTLLIFVALGVLLFEGLRGFDACAAFGGEWDSCALPGWADWLAATGGTMLLLWLTFPTVAIGVVGFSDEIVGAVEARHYPRACDAARPLGPGGTLLLGLASGARLLLWNFVALPFYLLLLVTGIGALILFLGVNAVVLGRDLAVMVAARHLDRPARRAWLTATRAERLVLGGLVTALFLVPLVNLLAPVLGAAMATHLFHGHAA